MKNDKNTVRLHRVLRAPAPPAILDELVHSRGITIREQLLLVRQRRVRALRDTFPVLELAPRIGLDRLRPEPLCKTSCSAPAHQIHLEHPRRSDGAPLLLHHLGPRRRLDHRDRVLPRQIRSGRRPASLALEERPRPDRRADEHREKAHEGPDEPAEHHFEGYVKAPPFQRACADL